MPEYSACRVERAREGNEEEDVAVGASLATEPARPCLPTPVEEGHLPH